MRHRKGFTLIELVTVVAIFAILLGILVPAIQQSRETARRNACRDNFRQLGVALAAYHDAHGSLPPTNLDPATFDASISPLAALLPYLNGESKTSRYDPAIPWSYQPADVAKMIVPQFLCPSRAHADLVASPSLALLNLPVGSEFATCDYILSKGPNDSWCLPEGPHKFEPIADDQLGAFGLGQITRLSDITDGKDTTIVMGEGVSGPRWPTATRKNSRKPFVHPQTGEEAESYNFWIVPRVNTSTDQTAQGIVMTSLYGTTAIPLNEPFVMETLAEMSALDDCRPSADGGPHRVSGFRSEHLGGGLFLFADGSVRFLHAELDPGLYRAFSTTRGEESIYFGK